MDDNFRRMRDELRNGLEIIKQDMEKHALLEWLFVIGGAIMATVGFMELFNVG